MNEKKGIIDTDKIRFVLFDSGLNNAEIARRTGLTAMYIGNLKRGVTKIDSLTIRSAIKIIKVWDEINKQ